MSHRQQSRNAAFAKRMKNKRITDRIIRNNKHLPGFAGATHGWTFTDPTTGKTRRMGPGAIFFDIKE